MSNFDWAEGSNDLPAKIGKGLLIVGGIVASFFGGRWVGKALGKIEILEDGAESDAENEQTEETFKEAA